MGWLRKIFRKGKRYLRREKFNKVYRAVRELQDELADEVIMQIDVDMIDKLISELRRLRGW